MCMNGFEPGDIAFHPCWSIIPPQKQGIWSALFELALSGLTKTPVLSFFLVPFLYVPSSFLVSRYNAVDRPLSGQSCPLLFVLCPLFFYPCANRRGRVPELDPIFHAQLSFVWHTAPDKNPNSSASLILKSDSGVERAFNHPLSVLQWLPFNLPGPMLFITGPRAETVPWKNPHPLTPLSHGRMSVDISDAALRASPHWLLLGNVSEMSLIVLHWNLSVSDVALGFGDSCEDTSWHYWISLSLNGHYIFHSLFIFRDWDCSFYFFYTAVLLLMSQT